MVQRIYRLIKTISLGAMVIIAMEKSQVSAIHNQLGLDISILAMGCKDIVISASAEGILGSDKHESLYIKPYAENISQPVKFAEKSWGSYKVIDVQDASMTVLMTLNPKHKMNYHSHEYRDEGFQLVEVQLGEGITIFDKKKYKMPVGVSI